MLFQSCRPKVVSIHQMKGNFYDLLVSAVCCDSSGNHGQALSWAATSVGKVCHVAVPQGAPAVKVAAIENYGGQVHFCEANDSGREAKVKNLKFSF